MNDIDGVLWLRGHIDGSWRLESSSLVVHFNESFWLFRSLRSESVVPIDQFIVVFELGGQLDENLIHFELPINEFLLIFGVDSSRDLLNRLAIAWSGHVVLGQNHLLGLSFLLEQFVSGSGGLPLHQIGLRLGGRLGLAVVRARSGLFLGLLRSLLGCNLFHPLDQLSNPILLLLVGDVAPQVLDDGPREDFINRRKGLPQLVDFDHALDEALDQVLINLAGLRIDVCSDKKAGKMLPGLDQLLGLQLTFEPFSNRFELTHSIDLYLF